MKKGVMNKTFHFVDVRFIDDYGYGDDDDVIKFDKNDEVEIVRIFEDKSFKTGIAYICYNPKNNESATFDSSFIDLI